MLEIVAHTDGACSGNPGPGGWGVLLRPRNGGAVVKERTLSGGGGGEDLTTNNRMELMAAIEALECLDRPSAIRIVADSACVKNGITVWLDMWKDGGWRTKSREPVKNQDLWIRLDKARTRHRVDWEWVRGHAGHEGNERADKLAREGRARFKAARTDARTFGGDVAPTR